jgi:hypothetical protein
MPNSNTRSIQVGSVDNTLIATAYNIDGSIKADLAFDTTGISIFVQRIGEANGSALTLSAKASASTSHADGAFLNLGGGDISVDCPDAPFATYKGRARIYGTFTGGTIIGEWFDVVGFDASVVAVGANTTTPPTPNQIMAGLVTGSQPAGSLARFVRDIKQADVLFEGTIITATSNTATLNGDATTVCVGQAITIGEEGDIERQTRWVVAFDPATKIVTLDSPWCVVPPDGSDYQIKVLRRSIGPVQVQEAASEAITDSITAEEIATFAKQEEILLAVSNISVELSPEDIEEISDAVSTAVSEGLVEEVEREGGMLQRLLSKFDGIDKLIRWIRQ